MVEYTDTQRRGRTVERSVGAGENIVAAGSEAAKADVMVARGTRVNHAIVAVAAAIGRAEVAVYRRPRVAILATGDELVDINLPPGPNEIRNSNSYSLAAQVYCGGRRADDPAGSARRRRRTGAAAAQRAGGRLLLITGGVSMGKYDLVEQVLASFEARILLHRRRAFSRASRWFSER